MHPQKRKRFAVEIDNKKQHEENFWEMMKLTDDENGISHNSILTLAKNTVNMTQIKLDGYDTKVVWRDSDLTLY